MIAKFAAGAGKKAGKFYTPPEVSELIAELVAPMPGERICDPTCGSGSLLIKCAKFVERSGSCNFSLFGQESVGGTWALAKMNMFLHGVDAAISHMVETMSLEHGRMAVVVPHGVLFRGSSEGKIRRQLIEENGLDAVIGLPSNLFFGTGIPAAILIFRRGKADDTVLFVDGSRDYADVKTQNNLRVEDIAKIVGAYQRRETIEKDAYLARFDEIRENDFNLNIPRYVDTFEEEAEIDIGVVQVEIDRLEEELSKVKFRMVGYLEELGL